MRYRVNILDSAVEDIDHLCSYLEGRWSKDVAERAYVDLMNKLALLETQPHLGNQVPELLQTGYPDYRLLVHDKHTKVLYRLDEAQQLIHIQMIFSSRQDFQTLLYHRIMRRP